MGWTFHGRPVKIVVPPHGAPLPLRNYDHGRADGCICQKFHGSPRPTNVENGGGGQPKMFPAAAHNPPAFSFRGEEKRREWIMESELGVSTEPSRITDTSEYSTFVWKQEASVYDNSGSTIPRPLHQ